MWAASSPDKMDRAIFGFPVKVEAQIQEFYLLVDIVVIISESPQQDSF